MNRNPFASMLISASAGSGKTYQLVLRFVSLLVLHEAPERVIAVTFTRKAAAEFASRIMARLAAAASSDEAAAQLAAEVARTVNGGGDQPGLLEQGGFDERSIGRDDFLRLLKLVVDRLGRLSLGTLDSFFSRMLNVLKFDLGMSDITVAADDELARARETVFREIYASEGVDRHRRNMFLEVFKQATLGRETDKLDTGLRTFVEDFHQYYLDAPEGGRWGNADLIWPDTPWWSDGPDYSELPLVAEGLVDETLSADLVSLDGKSPHSRLVQGLKKLRDDAAAGRDITWPGYVDMDFIKGLERGDAGFTYSSKEYSLSGAWAEGLLMIFKSTVKQAIEFSLERTKGVHALISAFETLYDRKVRQHGKLVFSDVARLLLPEWQGGGAKADSFEDALLDLSFRMDGWFSHWMLDEFQDTSNVQWNIVRPFLEEIAQDPDGGRSMFFVGDGKQSIYQWRGGSPKIFEELKAPSTIWGQTLKPWAMDVSYRSSPPVLELVNCVCRFDQTAVGAHAEALKRWHFAPHTARGDAAELNGCAQVIQIPKDGRDDAEAPDIPGTAEQRSISEILLELSPVERGLSCAILVDTNKNAHDMRDWLMSEEGGGINCHVEAEALVGVDSPIGAVLSDFFMWLQHPGDSFAWRHLSASPLRRWLTGKEPSELWNEWKLICAREGVWGVIREWERLIRKDCPELLSPYQEDRLGEWKQAAAEFDARGGSLQDWLSAVRVMKKKEHSRDDGIQIMTFHKAKGLEFDVVFLPMGGMKKFDNAQHRHVFREEDEWGAVQTLIIPPKDDVVKKDLRLSRFMVDWEAERQFEGFCKLYVALTRARRACYAFIPPPSGRESCSPAAIMHQAVLSQESAAALGDDEQGVLLSFGDPEWFQTCPLRKEDPPVPENVPCRLETAVKPCDGISPSRLAHGDGADSIASSRAMALGREVHELFQNVEWWPVDGEWETARYAGHSSEAVSLFLRAMDNENILQWFRKPEAAPVVRLWRERVVAGMWKGRFVSGVVDRAVFADGKLTVIDFKTDHADNMEQLKERYRYQLELYRGILCKALGIDENMAECVIVAPRLGESAAF